MLKRRVVDQVIEEMDRDRRALLSKMSFSRSATMPQFSFSEEEEDWHNELISEVTAMPSVPLWHVLVGWFTVSPVQWPGKFCSENCLGPTLGWGIDIEAKSVDTNQIDAIGCRLQQGRIHFKWSLVSPIHIQLFPSFKVRSVIRFRLSQVHRESTSTLSYAENDECRCRSRCQGKKKDMSPSFNTPLFWRFLTDHKDFWQLLQWWIVMIFDSQQSMFWWMDVRFLQWHLSLLPPAGHHAAKLQWR